MKAEIIFSSLLLLPVAYVLTWLVRKLAISLNLLAIPNERSSHTSTTPSGGGLGFVLAFLSGMTVYWIYAGLPLNEHLAILGAGGLIAFTGLIDDKYHIPSLIRLCIHLCAVLWVIVFFDYQFVLKFGDLIVTDKMLVTSVILLFVGWFINLFNFMDGIDGIAATEAVFILLSGATMLIFENMTGTAFLCYMLASTVAGFLVWNWPPASIFMGDTGSGFLGLLIAVFFFIYPGENLNLVVWIILSGVFIVDATYTLVVRILRREKWYQAHKSHTYQKVARKYGHRRTTISVLMLNFFWLLPLALLSWKFTEYAFSALLLAYIPLIVLALKYQAGIACE